MKTPSYPRIQAALLLLSLLTGCKSMPAPPTGDDVAPQRRERASRVVREFESRRDTAQYAAALTRWQEGDTDGCEAMLVDLLDRSPDHAEARLLLAELYLLEGAADDALAIVEHESLAGDIQPSRVAHTRGLALETLDRQDEAIEQFRQAVALEPGNDVYALSLKSALEPEAMENSTTADHRESRELRK